LWHGEWETGWIIFRDMGDAFMGALPGIRAQAARRFRGFAMPPVISSPFDRAVSTMLTISVIPAI